ncbi:MAG: prolyl aminopeptidase [Bdellovibrionales bacterium]|nr:prolyl aminopeptidase [Bdellovibrionales bacterium]
MNTRCEKHTLDVGQGHKLYIEDCGPKSAFPTLFLHGGPGAGFSEKDKTFFDLNSQRVIFFDQRGSGKSTPKASTENNTTQDLISDILSILDFFSIEQCIVFGGSWGSTLSLCFAIAHPEKVHSLILRGIFLGTSDENNHYFRDGANRIFPDVFEKFLQKVPREHQEYPIQYYEKMLHNKDIEKAEEFAKAFAAFEIGMASLHFDPDQVASEVSSEPCLAFAKIECHYLLRHCFLEEGHIMNNLSQIQDKNISIIHGRYDAICAAKVAYKLHKALPNSKLYLTKAGHHSRDEENFKALRSAVQETYQKLRVKNL